MVVRSLQCIAWMFCTWKTVETYFVNKAPCLILWTDLELEVSVSFRLAKQFAVHLVWEENRCRLDELAHCCRWVPLKMSSLSLCFSEGKSCIIFDCRGGVYYLSIIGLTAGPWARSCRLTGDGATISFSISPGGCKSWRWNSKYLVWCQDDSLQRDLFVRWSSICHSPNWQSPGDYITLWKN